MRKTRFICALLSLLLLLSCHGALAELDFVLPTPQPTEPPAEQDLVLPTPQSEGGALNTPVPVLPLPNPSNYFGYEGRLDQAEAKYGDGVYEVWFFPQNDHWNEYLKTWLGDCEKCGYSWNSQKISGVNGFVVSDGQMQAILIPDYGGQIMLMKPPLMEMEEGLSESMPDLNLGDIAISINGKVYTLHDQVMRYWYAEGSTSYSFTGSSGFGNPNYFSTKQKYAFRYRQDTGVDGLGEVNLTFPMLTSDNDVITLNSTSDKKKYNLVINDVKYLYYLNDYFTSNRFESQSDQCLVDIIYNDGARIIGSLDGTFDSGAAHVVLAFDLPIVE